jgi:NADH-ubiquinone oxidoreductase chain 4
MIKAPLAFGHIWLPNAHSEGPLSSSIILAGIVLKLALYAVLRIILPILPEASLYFTPLVYTICLITIIYTSLTTLREVDLKRIIAYSSIGHMGIVIIGAFSNTIQGIEGSILLGICHGLVSSGLFILLGGSLYDRYHTRNILYYRGLTQIMPLFSLMFFILILMNMATPLSGNFISEFMCLAGGFQRLPFITSLAASSIFLSAAYSIYLYNRICGGIKSPYIEVTNDLSRREFLIVLPLILLSLIIGIYPNLILEGLHSSVSSLIYNI